MASFTRKAIREAFLQLLEERMLSEITVKDIVERCGINRNSFYYHYRDLPALIEEIVQEEADAVIAEHASLHDMVDCFDAVVSFVTHRKRAILHIFRSVSRDVFERYLMKTCRYFVDTYLTAALMGEPVDPKDPGSRRPFLRLYMFWADYRLAKPGHGRNRRCTPAAAFLHLKPDRPKTWPGSCISSIHSPLSAS